MQPVRRSAKCVTLARTRSLLVPSPVISVWIVQQVRLMWIVTLRHRVAPVRVAVSATCLAALLVMECAKQDHFQQRVPQTAPPVLLELSTTTTWRTPRVSSAPMGGIKTNPAVGTSQAWISVSAAPVSAQRARSGQRVRILLTTANSAQRVSLMTMKCLRRPA